MLQDDCLIDFSEKLKKSNFYTVPDFFYTEVNKRLFDRAKFLKLKLNNVLDLGCGSGAMGKLILKMSPRANITALDLSFPTINMGKLQAKEVTFCCGDAYKLPFANASFDLVVSSITLPWLHSPKKVFLELKRILAPGGVLLVNTFGPDTLVELRQACAKIDKKAYIHNFLDMHVLGDVIQDSGFNDVVMDKEMLCVEYVSLIRLFADLKTAGAINLHPQRARGLRRIDWEEVGAFYPKNNNNNLPVSVELVYALAFVDTRIEKKIDIRTV